VVAKYEGLPALLTVSEVNSVTVPNPLLDNLVVFRRDVVHKNIGDDLQMVEVVNSSEEDNLILIMYPEEYVPKVFAQVSGTSDTLIQYVKELQSLLEGKKLTLFLMELDKYFRKLKKNTQQDFRNRVLNEDYDDAVQIPPAKKKKNRNELPTVSQQEFNSALVELQILTHVNYRVVKDIQELGVHFVHYAKAIAVAPFKRRKLQDGIDGFAFCDSGNIRVDKDGNGLKTLWIDQLMQFNTVGIDTAQAIAAKYPSPTYLFEAYNRCNTIEEGLELLKDIPVRMGIGPLARTRKVGPEISKRVYRFVTCNSGDRSLSRSHDH
jgi:crossover junction endonuclease EME1